MQPTLVLSASHPGILYINGHFAGEVSPEEPIVRPVGSRGPVYLDYRPFSSSVCSLTRRLVFSGGAPMEESADHAQNLSIIVWPGGAVEIEIGPESRPTSPLYFQLAGHAFALSPCSRQLSCEGRLLCSLPEGAEAPELRSMQGGIALVGRCSEGQYLFTSDEEFRRQTGFLCARSLDIEADGLIRAVATSDDLVGHAALETWRLTPGGLTLISTEPAWAHGAPRWPQTPEDTARAAVEAALAGLDAEAEGYLSPVLKSQFPLAAIKNRCDLCVKMKYSPDGARPCIGLLRLEGEHMARVQPMYFKASPSGGPQGPWQLESISYS